jgi:hypothetical protein
MVDEVYHQADHRHGTDKDKKQSDSLLISGQGVKAGVEHCQHTEKCQAKNHHFLHTSGFIEIVHENISFHAGNSEKKPQ